MQTNNKVVSYQMVYALIRPLLFSLNPELSHNLSLKAIKLLVQLKILPLSLPSVAPKQLMGLEFRNPVGLAAGFDKNGDYIDALGQLGFGFIEIGTITPKPQVGNPKPRLFRQNQEEAIINRMGFNNKGVDYLISKLSSRKYKGILGINIGKNATTPLEEAIEDYRYCFKKVYDYASYITINISSPNTQGLRSLQHGEHLHSLLQEIKKEQTFCSKQTARYVPIVVKIAPDLTRDEVTEIASIFRDIKIDGIIATNTTVDHSMLKDKKFAEQTGGLSGQPLFEPSTQVLTYLRAALGTKIPIISSGGIMSCEQAKQKIEQGADLVQLYSGLIFKGLGLIKDCCQGLDNKGPIK